MNQRFPLFLKERLPEGINLFTDKFSIQQKLIKMFFESIGIKYEVFILKDDSFCKGKKAMRIKAESKK